MDAQEYLTARVEQFIKWYDGKAVTAKRRFLFFRTTSVVTSLLIPIAVNVLPDGYSRAAATVLGLTAALAVALDGVYHFGDQWKNYRSTEQFLSREKFLFMTGEGPYKDLQEQGAFVLFVERCEAQIASENSATLNVILSSEKTEKAGKSS